MDNLNNLQPSSEELEQSLMDLEPLLSVPIKEEILEEPTENHVQNDVSNLQLIYYDHLLFYYTLGEFAKPPVIYVTFILLLIVFQYRRFSLSISSLITDRVK